MVAMIIIPVGKGGDDCDDDLQLYRPERGVTLRESGLHFVRAVAVADQFLQSHIFTSK